jgi:hypothetical protein
MRMRAARGNVLGLMLVSVGVVHFGYGAGTDFQSQAALLAPIEATGLD